MDCIGDSSNLIHISFSDTTASLQQTYQEEVKMSYVLLNCMMTSETNIIIKAFSITLPSGGGSHSNLLIYRRNTGELEHFEPHGSVYGGSHKYEVVKYINNVLQNIVSMMNDVLPTINIDRLPDNQLKLVSLIKAQDICPDRRGVQAFEEQSHIPKTIIEPFGYCSAWSMFFTELCLKNPEASSRQIYTAILKKSDLYSNKNDYLRNVIRGYTCFINNKIAKHFSKLFSDHDQQLLTNALNGDPDSKHPMNLLIYSIFNDNNFADDAEDERLTNFYKDTEINTNTSSSSIKSDDKESPERIKENAGLGLGIGLKSHRKNKYKHTNKKQIKTKNTTKPATKTATKKRNKKWKK